MWSSGVLYICCMLYAIVLFVSWNVLHTWKAKTAYMNFMDCTHNLSSKCAHHDTMMKKSFSLAVLKQFSSLDG